jgi:hypothetical protein
MQAPLGRAVIGGLIMSTFATLLVLPSLFAILIGRRVARSPSLYPEDHDSAHYDPRALVPEGGSGEEVAPRADTPPESHPQLDGHNDQTDGGPGPQPAPSAPASTPTLPGDSR